MRGISLDSFYAAFIAAELFRLYNDPARKTLALRATLRIWPRFARTLVRRVLAFRFVSRFRIMSTPVLLSCRVLGAYTHRGDCRCRCLPLFAIDNSELVCTRLALFPSAFCSRRPFCDFSIAPRAQQVFFPGAD